MGCGNSSAVPPTKAKITKKSRYGHSYLDRQKSDLKNSRSPSINSQHSQKSSSPSPQKDFLRRSSLTNVKTSTNSSKKIEKQEMPKVASDKNLRKSQQNLTVSPSKIKLEVKEVIEENE